MATVCEATIAKVTLLAALMAEIYKVSNAHVRSELLQQSIVLTAVQILTVPVPTRQATSLIFQGIEFTRRQLGFVLEVTELAILTVSTQVPIIAHLLSCLLHAYLESRCGLWIPWWQGFVEPLFGLIVISVLLGLIGLIGCDRDSVLGF